MIGVHTITDVSESCINQCPRFGVNKQCLCPPVVRNMGQFVVIGGSSGIGECLVRLLSAEGHTVIATYHRHPPTHTPDGVRFHSLDVTDDSADFSFLPEKVDGLVFTPGSIILRPFGRFNAADFIRDYELQVLGAVKSIQAALPALKNSGSGSVVLFSTVAVQTGFPFHSLVSASKGALEGLTRALAAEFAPLVRVNAIAPSVTDTPLASSLLSTDERRSASAQRHPLKRVGTPEDIAQAARFLLSAESGWLTGQIMHVDGGISALRT